ncbi:NADPH-dependent FMN reductase [Pleurostoma richardsiae]|jgi:NAD(P)H-dependent FMN reductase|uniref:NADPH-dependent FMN reductase n=1 Tax=Pleurostoma richardsiae TaxID=41990 RepID=A0AA38R5K1_9PEZI|nr:NADPH-dependent FMN reductase [Pleurostoma richardsiae]
MPAPKTFRIGIICGSQRTPRVGDQVADFVAETIQAHIASAAPSASGPSFAFDRIDVAALGLPLFDEPGIPSKIEDRPAGYAHEHTRRWSARVAALDGFVFVTPQYNWGIPAGLKNAIDYLFHEWRGKPAVVVAYGGHGGDKCSAQMRTVLAGGVDMQVGDRMVVNLSFPSREVLYKAAKGEDIGVKGPGAVTWRAERKAVVAAWEQMAGLLASEGLGKVVNQVSGKFRQIKLALEKA